MTLLFVGAVVMAHAVDGCVIPVVRSPEQAPVIDGVMQGNEWQYALGITGLLGNTGELAQRQGKVYYLSDGRYLYLGMYAPAVPAGTAPVVKEGPAYDGTKYGDLAGNDRVEVKFRPPNSNVVGDYYFVGDAAGHTYVEHIQGEHVPLQADWEYKTSYDERGWTVELRIPLATLGQDKLAEGARWQINFTLMRLFPLTYDGLVAGGPHALCAATVQTDTPAVQVESLGELAKGRLDLAVAVRDYEGVVATPKESAYDERKLESGGLVLTGTGKAARVVWTLADAGGQRLAEGAQVLPLAPGKKVVAQFARDFQSGTKGTLTLKVELANSAKEFDGVGEAAAPRVLYAATMPFAAVTEQEAQAFQERLTKGTVLGSWRFNPAFFPYWGKAKVQAVFFKGKVRDQARSLRVTITADNGFHAFGDAPVVDGTLVPGTPDKLLEIAIPGLPAGTYQVRGEVLDADGKVIATKETQYQRIVYPWEHNTLGTTRGVIKPWTEMSVRAHDIACWGRTYTVDAAGWPAQIASQDRPLLAAPVTLELRGADGQPLAWTPTGAVTFAEQAVDRVRWQGQATLGADLGVTLTGLAEYDGFTWYEVTLTPARPVPVTVGRIVIALPEQQAQLLHFQSCWARNNYSGAVPAGTGVVFRSRDTTNYGKPGGFSPHFWVGNPTRGLSWFADSDEGWSSAADQSALEIVRDQHQVQVVMNIIARPVTLDRPRTIRFGLMATPFKPLLPIRDLQTRAVNWLSVKDGKTVVQDHMYGWYPPQRNYALIDEHVPGLRLYFNKHEMGAALPERAVFDHEWGGMEPAADYPGAPERFGPGIQSRAINRALTDSRIDLLVYDVAELAKRTKMAATYWDITGIGVGLPLRENGTAYRDPETGAVVPTFDILKSRQLFKRVATAWQEIRGEPDYMEIHSTNHMGVPFYSFAYNWLNFEWLWPNAKARRPDGRWQDFIDLRPLELFATEGSPSQFGVWINSINGGQRPEEPAEQRRIDRSARALAMLHNHSDPGMSGAGLTPPPSIGRRDQLTFVGYWDEAGRVTTDHREVRASYWCSATKVELAVVNLGLEPCTVTVDLALAPLGWRAAGACADTTDEPELAAMRKLARFKASPALLAELDTIQAQAIAARTPPVVRVADGHLLMTITLAPHDYRLFTLEQP